MLGMKPSIHSESSGHTFSVVTLTPTQHDCDLIRSTEQFEDESWVIFNHSRGWLRGLLYQRRGEEFRRET